MPDKLFGCFNPARDVVAAPYFQNQEVLARATYSSSFKPAAVPQGRLLFFGGSIRMNEPEYSGGVRQVQEQCAMCTQVYSFDNRQQQLGC